MIRRRADIRITVTPTAGTPSRNARISRRPRWLTWSVRSRT